MTETSPTPTRGDSFPRQYARTVRFSLGVPTGFTIAPDGGQALFLRAPSGSDRAVCLWSIDLATGAERLLADPSVLLDGGTEDLTPEERARRERSRQAAGGIVGYGTDSAVRTAVFTLSSRLFLVDVASGAIRELAAAGPVIDPRIDPTGRRVAYVTGNALHVLTLGTDGAPDTDVALAVPEHELISYGLAEFVAAEEMDRSRGYWWAPDGDRLLVARVDETPVKIVYLSDPANPEQPPVAWRYPMTGTANAVVTAHVFGVDGTRVDVEWDNDAFCYLTTAHWSAGGAPLIAVQDRAQHVIQVLAIDPATGATKPVAEERDEIWTDIHPGVPAWTEDGRLVRVAPRDDRNRVLVDERPVTGTDLHVRGVIAVGAHD
jgi:dipeptidyl-peptidase-4